MSFQTLMQDYQAERKIKLTEKQFATLLYMFPVLLVAASDYTLDRIEMGYINSMVRELSEELNQEGLKGYELHYLQQAYITEMKYLLMNLPTWEKRLLDAARELLEDRVEMKSRIRALMLAVAESSNGINKYEQEKINTLCKHLKIGLS